MKGASRKKAHCIQIHLYEKSRIDNFIGIENKFMVPGTGGMREWGMTVNLGGGGGEVTKCSKINCGDGYIILWVY